MVGEVLIDYADLMLNSAHINQAFDLYKRADHNDQTTIGMSPKYVIK